MEKNVIGSFSATTFNNKTINFIVFDDNTMNCPTLGVESFSMVEMKPRFVLWADRRYTYGRFGSNITDDLVSEYNIDEDLFSYLKGNHMISYSTEMAMLYGFSDTNGFNNRYLKRPYKKANKKGTAFKKQRMGQFN